MKGINITLAVACVMWLSNSCGKKSPAEVRDAEEKVEGVKAGGAGVDFQSFIETKKEALFGSRQGKMMGFDSDAALNFRIDGSVTLIEYSVGVSHYHGVFSVSESGDISLTLDDYHGTWPTMVAKMENGDLLLHRKDGVTSYAELEVENNPFAGFWPFAVIEK